MLDALTPACNGRGIFVSTSRPQQPDLIAVRVFHKHDNGRARIHGTGFADNLAAAGANLLHRLIDIIHLDGDMAEAIAQVIVIHPPVVSQFQHQGNRMNGTIVAC